MYARGFYCSYAGGLIFHIARGLIVHMPGDLLFICQGIFVFCIRVVNYLLSCCQERIVQFSMKFIVNHLDQLLWEQRKYSNRRDCPIVYFLNNFLSVFLLWETYGTNLIHNIILYQFYTYILHEIKYLIPFVRTLSFS